MIFAVCILCFGNAIYILNRSRLAENEESQEPKDPLFDRAFGNDLIDAMLSQYNYGYAADQFELYAEAPNLIWVYYIIMVFFIQITFMNMIINLMMESFAFVETF